MNYQNEDSFGHCENAQRYTAHTASAGNQEEMKNYHASIMKDAKKLDFAMSNTQALPAYRN